MVLPATAGGGSWLPVADAFFILVLYVSYFPVAEYWWHQKQWCTGIAIVRTCLQVFKEVRDDQVSSLEPVSRNDELAGRV
jgi:hypothetical protein